MGYEVWQKSVLVARSNSIITCCTDNSLSFFFQVILLPRSLGCR
jgi:hypothetical protein